MYRTGSGAVARKAADSSRQTALVRARHAGERNTHGGQRENRPAPAPVATRVASRHTFHMLQTLSPEDVTALRDAVVVVLDPRIERLDQSLSRQFAAVNERLDLVERRIARLEERVVSLVQGHTRARTSDIDRIAALEARLAELEAKLAAKE